jgi:N6-adenosine-specific RNA methylase IME4
VIYADPPWPWDTYGPAGQDRSPENHYPTMDLEGIAALPVGDMAAPDGCVLFLWTTGPHLANAIKVLSDWGFAYKSFWAWDKVDVGTGYWGRSVCELLLIGTRGKVSAPAQGAAPVNLYQERRGKHSAKPEWFAKEIEKLFPGLPRIELFRRGPARPGWDAWGNEAETCAETQTEPECLGPAGQEEAAE